MVGGMEGWWEGWRKGREGGRKERTLANLSYDGILFGVSPFYVEVVEVGKPLWLSSDSVAINPCQRHVDVDRGREGDDSDE